MLIELTLKNFRGFDVHTLYFRPTTVMVGKNNAGKSTTTEALRLVSAISRRSQTTNNYHSIPSWLDRPRRERCIFPSHDDFAFNNNIFHRFNEPPAHIHARFKSGETIEVFVGPDSKIVGIIHDKNGDCVHNRHQAQALKLPDVGILPQIGPLLSEEKRLRDDYVRTSINSPRSSLHFRNQLYLLNSHFPLFKALGESTWDGILIHPVNVSEADSDNNRWLSLLVRDGDFTAEVGWMGHGLQMWLQTMWFLTHSRESSCIILDEPDVYMHADLQRKLIRLLRKRTHQTIVATHSIEIMSEVEPDEILIIDHRKRSSNFAGSAPEVQAVLSNIGSIHNVQLAKLNAAGRVIMVEGDDIAFLKRFQNTLFPDTASPIDALPHKSLGGWSGWERARGLASLLREVAPTAIQLYCILDSDCHTPASIKKRVETAKREGIHLHIWQRKEIENYLLVPSAICRAIRNIAPPSVEAPTISQVSERLEKIAEQLKDDTENAIATELFDEDRRRKFKMTNKMAKQRVARSWKKLLGKLTIISGKKAINKLADWANKEFHVSLNAQKLAKELTPEEIDDEVKQVLTAIEESTGFL